MENRYIELKEFAKANNNWAATPKKLSVHEDILQDFVKKARVVSNYLEELQENTESLKELKKEIKNTTDPEQEKDFQEKIQRYVDSTKKISKVLKTQLDEMTKDTESSKANDPNEPETRSMIIQTRSLASKFSDCLKENQMVQQAIKDDVKDKVKRQVKIIKKDLKNEEVERISENPQAFQELVAEQTLGKAHLKLYYGVQDIMEKYNEIKKLETSVENILSLMNDMALLVEKQGDVLLKIETHLNDAKSYTEKAVVVLKKEQDDHRNRRKKYCCMLMTLLIIILLVVFFVLR